MSKWFQSDDFDDEEDEACFDECPECGGDRTVECDCTGGFGKEFVNDDCPACDGSGKHTCPACGGRGYI